MNDKKETQFNILCLSGGGFRGLYTAKVLSELEEHINKPIAHSFDLISGTSVGGIIAIAIALEIPAEEVLEKFKLHGKKIFPPKLMERIPCINWKSGLLRSKYQQDGIKNLVSEIFGNEIMGDIQHRLIIPAVNYSTGKPQIFKTPHHSSFKKDKTLKLVDIALATSAAPYYLPVHEIDGRGSYVDGGLYGNAPDILALHEAQYFLEQKIADIHIMSIGTMSPKTVRDAKRKTNMGILNWGENLFSLTISAQEQIVEFQLKHLLKERYYKIDAQPASTQEKRIGLDVATEAAIKTLESQGASSAQYFLGNQGLLNKFLFRDNRPISS